MSDEVAKQRDYYTQSADRYDDMREWDYHYHNFALNLFLGALQDMEVASILDVGAGTGEALQKMKAKLPGVRAAGIEPVAALREAGHRKGVPADELTDGDALDLQFKDGEFDFVTAFAILHHIREPRRAVAEMLRVAKQGIFISDANNYAQGTAISRPIKQVIHALGLWKLFDFAKTRGKGYIETEEDGISYSYSVFNDYPYLRERCGRVHVINIANITRMNKGAIHDAKGINPYRNASTVALLAIKEPWATVED